jgi:hypothetical protein
MNDSSSAIDLDEIVEEFTEQCRSGRRSSVENYAKRYLQFAEKILDLFPTLLTMEQAAPESDDEFERMQDDQLEGFGNEEPCPERLGDTGSCGELDAVAWA